MEWSPFPKLVKLVILAQAIDVARRPVAMRMQMRNFSVLERWSVRMSLMGMRARMRSIDTYTPGMVSMQQGSCRGRKAYQQ
jgi:hypothetical protein